MPPRLPPITAAQRSMPSRSASRAWRRDPVAHAHRREIRAPEPPVAGLTLAGPVLPRAAADVVQADHEEAVGVDGLAGADAVVPPAGLALVRRVVARGMVVAAQRMADQHGIGARPRSACRRSRRRCRSPAACARRRARAAASKRCVRGVTMPTLPARWVALAMVAGPLGGGQSSNCWLSCSSQARRARCRDPAGMRVGARHQRAS